MDHQWIIKMWSIYEMEYNSGLKRMKLSFILQHGNVLPCMTEKAEIL
jgi:hypothetical protein